ncbi:MAG: hypothetical protein ABIM85_03265 [candidate division WOR-3 bacterium]
MKRLKIFLLTLIFISCKKEIEKVIIPDYIVWCVLKSSKKIEEQIVFVDRLYSPDEVPSQGVSGCSVKIKFGGKEYLFKEKIVSDIDSNEYLVYYDTFYVPSGIDCTLKIEFPDSRELLKVTKVPTDFNIIYPIYDTIYVPSNNLLIWNKSEGAKFYVIYLENTPDSLFYIFFSPDTLFDLFRRESAFKSEGIYRVYVRAENEDLYYWNLNRSDRIEEEWVKGVFGAYVERRKSFYIKK